MKRWIVITLIVLAVAGLSDSSYLVAHHYQGTSVNCSVGGKEVGDCETVLSSKYATVRGIPIALFGVFYYGTLLVLSAFLLSYKTKKFLYGLIGISGLGMLVSLGLVYVQLGVLNEICIYCMTSAAITTLIFVVSVLGLKSFLQQSWGVTSGDSEVPR